MFGNVYFPKNLCEAVLEKSGTEYNMRMLQEECCELSVAIAHVFRKDRDVGEAFANLLEELSDVGIMLDIVMTELSSDELEKFNEMLIAKQNKMKGKYGL